MRGYELAQLTVPNADVHSIVAVSNIPFPDPDWINTNTTWAAEQLGIYLENRTGKLFRNKHPGFPKAIGSPDATQWLTLSSKGPMTIPSFGGSSVAFLPLQNVTSNYKDIIDTASRVNLSALLPSGIDPSIIAGYAAQIDQLLQLYASPHAAVEEVAWAGYASVCNVLIRPLSRGTIMINTTDSRKPPLYDFGTFSHPSDLEVAVRTLEKVREWIASPSMQALGPIEILPGASSDDSDEAIAAAIRGFATSSWQHPTSSCSMLKRELGGVVDSQLRVYGVQGLRVVDASIFPMAIGGHTSSTVYAVAEKVSEPTAVNASPSYRCRLSLTSENTR